MVWDETDDQPYCSPGAPKRDVKWYILEDVDSRAKWFTILLFFTSLGMLIAGSVMLGIGISNNNSNNNCPVSQPVYGYTIFVTAQTRALPYSSVVNNFSESVHNLTEQMRQIINPSSSLQFAAQQDVPITILGISNAGQWADVMYALSYTDSNKPAISDIQKKVTDSTSFVLVSTTNQTAPSLNQMICSAVADNTLTTVTPTLFTTTGKTFTTATITSNPATGQTNTDTVETTTTGLSKSSISTLTPLVTQPDRTTTTQFVKTPYSMDVIILLDDSTAMQTAKIFNKVKSWIVNALIPLWAIDREDVQVAFATFADTEFNMLLDFDEENEQEVIQVISAQMYSGKHNSSITNGIRAAGDIHGLRPVNQTVILISASESLTDIEAATQYAYVINTLPKQMITVTVNSATSGKQLGLLSTNQNHFFGVPDFNLTSDIAKQVTQYMFGTLTPTSVPSTTTAVPDNACKSDITIILDNNNDVGSLDEYHNQLKTITKLIKTWPINPALVEGQAIAYATTEGGTIVENPFTYQSASTFANEVMAYDDFYFARSSPNLTASLQYLSNNLNTRRKNREQTTILFTYSSDITDVLTAVEFVDQIGGNLIVVATKTADPTILKQLSGNVIYSKNMTTDIIYQINSLICVPTTRAPFLTETTSTSTSSSTAVITTASPQLTMSTVTTTAATGTTTSLPNPCPDCFPKRSNILLVLEAYSDLLQNQKEMINNALITKWTKFERTSVMAFGPIQKYLDPINFNDLQNAAEFMQIVDSLTAFKQSPTIITAFNVAVRNAVPLKNYGRMNTVLFTSGATSTEITGAMTDSQALRAKGKVILVGMKLQDSTGLESLCDVFLKWDNLTETSDISTQINNALNS